MRVARAITVGEGVDHIAFAREWRWCHTCHWRNDITARILHHWWCWRSCVSSTVDGRRSIVKEPEATYIYRITIGRNMRCVCTTGIGERVDHVALAREWR